ncbi:serine/threonine-protein kinase ATM isoform X2 [Cynara cardunculus var. scolymus]|uniref:PWWP domain-containing protein n=1 Tax=Cynara cardunculus var. scolymus TaxID=59895 RepID=A0A124SE45_CYNCS|nr:serine/threonine-protein kinase ATM isoform X2 [Cynara cardunculus var. scolymus]KVH98937.1 hypothetical protein Ccrd_022845 [Cynara cardunculus var. scolymus]
METLKTSETLVEGLVASKQDGLGNPVEGGSFDFVEEKCVESVSNPVPETGGIKGFEPVAALVASVTEIGGRVDSSSHGDVPIKGISLFVELTGGVTSDGLHHSEDRVSLGNKLDTDGLVNGNQGEVIFCHQECRPNLGDFVWAVIKNQSWWPGIVCDGSNAPKEASKTQKPEDGLLVRCFGNGSYVRCLPYQLKPFVAYFEQFSKQNKSKSFVGALEKAVAEFGHRIKTEFTCSCFSKTMVEGKGDVGNLSATRFQPATFVDYIKDLARDISMSTKIDYAVNQNFLSAFYRSLGHCQIGLHQLKPASIKAEEENWVFNGDANTENKNISFVMGDDIKNEKSEKHYETRERRKSRFLSYPYTDVNGVKRSVSGERGMEESGVDVNGGMELNKANGQPVKKPRKKWCRKSVRKDDLAGKGVPANVCSSEVLSELQSAAQDCLFPIESTKFDSVERFIAGFRKWAFNDFTKEITIDLTAGQENGIGMGMVRTIDVNTTVDMAGKGTRGRAKKVRKKNNNKPVSSPISGTNPSRGSLIINFQNVGSQALETQAMPNKNMEVVADQVLQDNEVKEVISESNGKCTILDFGDLPVKERPPCKLTPKRRKKNVASKTAMHILPNVNGHVDPFLIHNLPQMNNLEGLNQPNVFHLTNEVGLTPPCSTENHGEPQGMNHEPKKRGRKRKTIDLQANPGSAVMPDLNENGAEKKRGKKVKTKETGVPCVDLSYNKVQQDTEEVTGTAFLLKFSSDHPLPSKQDLNSIFCKFGALNESETQVLDDSRSGQVVFLDSSSAGEAFWGLQNHHPFGQALVNYRIQHLSSAESNVGFRTPIKNPSLLKPLDSVSMGSQAISSSTVIPDLNGNTGENKLLKKRKKIAEGHLPSTDLSYGKVQQGNGEATVFCRYGTLNELETQVSPLTLSGQVVFVNPSSAGEAVQNLEKVRPFGETLVSFRVHHLYNVEPAIGFKNPLNVPLGLNKQAPDLGVIKKNLEMMTMMMEKAGDTLSPEMRAKLESEIKGLMNKVSTMDGSSSSSL